MGRSNLYKTSRRRRREGLVNHSRASQASQFRLSLQLRRTHQASTSYLSIKTLHSKVQRSTPHPPPKLRIASADEAANVLAFEMTFCNKCDAPTNGPPGLERVSVACRCRGQKVRCNACTWAGNVRLKCCSSSRCSGGQIPVCNRPDCVDGWYYVQQACSGKHVRRR